AGDAPQQGGLAAAGRSHHADELPGVEVEADVRDGLHAPTVTLVNLAKPVYVEHDCSSPNAPITGSCVRPHGSRSTNGGHGSRPARRATTEARPAGLAAERRSTPGCS